MLKVKNRNSIVNFEHVIADWDKLLRKSPYSFQIRENTDQKNLRIWTLFTQCLSLAGYHCFLKSSNPFEQSLLENTCPNYTLKTSRSL